MTTDKVAAPRLKHEQFTPINTLARQIVASLDSRRLMRIEVGPGGKKQQLAIDIVEDYLWTLANELDDPLA